jgi:betaine-aldehyde dehydrogenase
MATVAKAKLRNFIGGEAVEPAEGGYEEVVNPATGETIAEAPLSTKADVDKAVAAARRAFEDGSWATIPPNERARASTWRATPLSSAARQSA